MPSFFLYLIKVNIALIVFYVLYFFVLRKLTFYTLNRWYLLGSIAISSVFPVINLSNLFANKKMLNDNTLLYYAPNWDSVKVVLQTQPQDLTIWTVLYFIYWIGVLVMSVYFVVQILSLLKIHQASNKEGLMQNVRITQNDIQPFSFLKNIYINPTKHSWKELQTIVQHEKVHITQLHSIDLILAEINKIFYWFNPGVWLLKNAIRENVEFIADKAVLEAGKNKQVYQYELLQVMTGIQHTNGLANHFSLIHLKNRITMMNKLKSSKWSKAKYLLLLPVLCVVVVVVAQKKKQAKATITNPSTTAITASVNKVAVKPITSFEQKVFALVGSSTKPVWIVDGVPCLVAQNWIQQLDKSKLENENDFTLFVDKIEMSMNEVNKTVNRMLITSGGTFYGDEKTTVFKKKNGFLIYLNDANNNLALSTSDTVPVKATKLNDKGYFMEVHNTKGTAYAVAYNKNRKEVSRVKINDITAAWEKIYGAIPPPPPPFEQKDWGNGLPKEIPVITDDMRKTNLPFLYTDQMEFDEQNGTMKMSGRTVINSRVFEKAIIFIDGIESTIVQMETVSPNDIKQVNVIMGEKAIKDYGEKGKNGVLIIITKKFAKESSLLIDIEKKSKNTMQVFQINGKTIGTLKTGGSASIDELSDLVLIDGEKYTLKEANKYLLNTNKKFTSISAAEKESAKKLNLDAGFIGFWSSNELRIKYLGF